MEVKNWESPTIPAEYRELQRLGFDREMANSKFWDNIIGKFEGTHDCLSNRGERPLSPVLLLLLNCEQYTLGQTAPDISILERMVARSSKISDGRPAVLPFHQLTTYVPTAAVCPCTSAQATPFLCADADKVEHCSQKRQQHRKPRRKSTP